jgi:hypothetical protein
MRAVHAQFQAAAEAGDTDEDMASVIRVTANPSAT